MKHKFEGIFTCSPQQVLKLSISMDDKALEPVPDADGYRPRTRLAAPHGLRRDWVDRCQRVVLMAVVLVVLGAAFSSVLHGHGTGEDVSEDDVVPHPKGLEPNDNPMRCEPSDSTACGVHEGRGDCLSRTDVADETLTQLDNGNCWWLTDEGVDEGTAPENLCRCAGHFDGPNCAWCTPGWNGTNCDTPLLVRRWDWIEGDETLKERVNDMWPARDVDLQWMHAGVLGGSASRDLPSDGSKPAFPLNIHFNSVWFLVWHRPLLSSTEELMRSTLGLRSTSIGLPWLPGARVAS